MSILRKPGQAALVCLAALALSACAGAPTVKRTQAVAENAQLPYQHVLLLAVFASYDERRNLENEIAKRLAVGGTKTSTSTRMMDSTDPINLAAVQSMLAETSADAVLVTQIVSDEASVKLRDANPEATYKVRPTYYFNVWDVSLTEYVEPPSMQTTDKLVLSTELFAADSQEPVWAIESKMKIVKDARRPGYFEYVVKEADAIASYMQRDGLVAN